MEDGIYVLLGMFLLAVPAVLIIILLAVFISKTNRLDSRVAEVESNLRLISRDVSNLVRTLQTFAARKPAVPSRDKITAPVEEVPEQAAAPAPPAAPKIAAPPPA